MESIFFAESTDIDIVFLDDLVFLDFLDALDSLDILDILDILDSLEKNKNANSRYIRNR